MFKRVENVKIVFINEVFEVKKIEIDVKINIISLDQFMSFFEQEEKMFKDMVDYIVQIGVNVVFVQKGIDDFVQYYFVKYGIMVVRRVKKSDMEKFVKVIGVKIVINVKDFILEDFGYVEVVEERKFVGENMIFVEGCKNLKVVIIFICGGIEYVIDEVERVFEDVVKVVKDVMEDGVVFLVGGVFEIEFVIRFDEYVKQVGGKEVFVIENFVDVFKIILKIFVENVGFDIVEMFVKVISEYKNRGFGIGIDVFEGKLVDMFEKGIIELFCVKKQVIKSVSEVVIMIFRIDDVIVVKVIKFEGGQGGGMFGGMGGMDMGM